MTATGRLVADDIRVAFRPARRGAAPTVAPFDYFPTHYVNQAKDVEPPIDQF